MPRIINSDSKIVRALPVQTGENLMRKYSLLHKEILKIILNPRKNSDKFKISNLRNIDSHPNSLNSFQRVVDGRQLESNNVFNCQILRNRILDYHPPEVSTDLSSFYYQNLRSGPDGKIIRKISSFRNGPFRDTRLKLFESDLRNNLLPEFRKHYRHIAVAKIVNGRIIPKWKELSLRDSFRKSKRYVRVRESRRVIYTSVRKLSMRTLPVENQAHNYDSGEFSYLNDGLRLDTRTVNIRSFANNLQYTRSKTNDTTLDAELKQRPSSLQLTRNFKSDNLWKRSKQELKRRFDCMDWRRENRNVLSANRLGLQKEIVAKERLAFEIRIDFPIKSLDRQIRQIRQEFPPFLENNCEKKRRENMKITGRRRVSSNNSSQKEVVDKRIISINYRNKVRRIEKNKILVEYEQMNLNRELGWRNYFESIFQSDRLAHNSRGAQRNELTSIFKVYPKNGNSNRIWSACNEMLIILIGLCTLHGSFIYAGKDKLSR